MLMHPAPTAEWMCVLTTRGPCQVPCGVRPLYFPDPRPELLFSLSSRGIGATGKEEVVLGKQNRSSSLVAVAKVNKLE